MGNEVFVDLKRSIESLRSLYSHEGAHLHHGNDRLLGVRKFGFTTDAEKLLVVNHAETPG